MDQLAGRRRLGQMIFQKEFLRRVLYLCLWLIATLSPAHGKDIDLSSLSIPEGFHMLGAMSGDLTGVTVCSAGDVNGDNIADILVLSEAYNANLGVVYVIYGRPTDSTTDINLATRTTGDVNGFRILGSNGLTSMSGLGDVNGDGLGDIIVGSRDASEAIVIFGQNLSAPSSYVDDVSFNVFESAEPFGFRINGGTSVDSLGTTVRGPGDINNDGMNDILVAAPYYQYQGAPSQAGIVYVIYGRNVLSGDAIFDTIDVSTLGGGSVPSDPIGFAILGAMENGIIGLVMAGAGDVDHSGTRDIIIGAPELSSDGKFSNGITYVVFGRDVVRGPSASATIDLAVTGSGWFQIDGAADSDASGVSVSGAGDVNGDGIDDFLIGASNAESSAGAYGGVTYVVFGRDVANGGSTFDVNLYLFGDLNTPSPDGFRINGAVNMDRSGSSVSGAGDMNGDGLADVIIGAYSAGAGGISYVVYGRLLEATDVTLPDVELAAFDTDPSLGFRILAAAADDQSGYSVSGAGDVNGDGLADVIVGSKNYDPPNAGGDDAGAAYVIFGSPPEPTVQPTPIPSPTPTIAPSKKPFLQSTTPPSALPTSQPSSQPTLMPTAQHLARPTAQPSTAPSSLPSSQPTCCPSSQPSVNPSAQPSSSPSMQPSARPSGQPSAKPTGQPSVHPSAQPSGSPSAQPSGAPSSQPSGSPTSQPSAVPSSSPSGQPSSQPSRQPSGQPSRVPSAQPSMRPSSQPSTRPSSKPSSQPTSRPSRQPFGVPTGQPSVQPSSQPSSVPSTQPTALPTAQPSMRPSGQPSSQPSSSPSGQPSARPTAQPSTLPSSQPSSRPSGQPSVYPSAQPSSVPSTQPTAGPTVQPSGSPSAQSSATPSSQPSETPSTQPSSSPSSQPSGRPTGQPSSLPSSQPSSRPSGQSSGTPSRQPSGSPSAQPSSRPTGQPSRQPSSQPSSGPSRQPSRTPSTQPSCSPSALPSSQPSVTPSRQPSSQPSCQPSERPSAQPTSLPSSQPSAEPSGVPSSVPSMRPEGTDSQHPVQPRAAPSCKPSHQPTQPPSSLAPVSNAPTALLSGATSPSPSAAPSLQPTESPLLGPSTSPVTITPAPSTQPTAQAPGTPSAPPTALTSCQPTHTMSTPPSAPLSPRPSPGPSTQHSALPTRVPSALPTPVAGGEWATLVTRRSSLSQLSVISGQVWACGPDGNQTTTSCALLDARTGDIAVMYQFHWTHTIAPVISTTAAGGSVVLSARMDSTNSVMSEIANCAVWDAQLFCDVTAFTNTRFVAVSYLSYPNRIVYFGTNTVYLSATILDVTPDTVRSFIYTLFNMKAVVLSQVQSPPNFIGSFVAGTAVRDVGSPLNFIVAGMLRTDGGVLSAMSVVPVDGDITTTVDLVTSTALETTGPDLFIVGGLEMSDGIGQHAYLMRVNALYNTIAYCVRYRTGDQAQSEMRRALTSANILSSVTRGVAYTNGDMYLLVEATRQNMTSTVVLKMSTDTGAITRQAHLSVFEGSLVCTDITSSGLYLVVACILQHNSTAFQSVVISVDSDLTFSALPAAIVRNNSTLFHAETVPFQRSVVSVTTTSTRVATSSYQFNTADQAPSRRPTATPSSQPSSQPSSAPSAQPSSSPTVAPTVSPRPTSTPSTSGPTNTHKPSAAPTIAPTSAPTVTRTTKPSTTPTTRPSLHPSAKPSVVPSKQPTPTPSLRPTRVPTPSPSKLPTIAPSAAPVRVPSAPPTAGPTEANNESNSNRSTVIWSAVGGALFFCVCGYGWYQYKLHRKEEDARAKRKAEYFAYQALLVAALEKEREEIIQQIRLEDARKEKNRKKQRAKAAGGNGASADVEKCNIALPNSHPRAPVGAFAEASILQNEPLGRPSTPVNAPPTPAVLSLHVSSSGGDSSHSSSSASSSDSSSSYNISSLHTSEADFADYY